jgi:putative CocE/NonD family hydrolase
MKLHQIPGVVVLVLLFTQGCKEAKKEPPGYVRENYTKREVYIHMRDGVKLFTAIYTPKDASQKYPILLMRTPYSCSPYGENNYPSQLGTNVSLMEEKYIYVYQDVRGRYKSEGQFREMTPANDHKQTKNETDESSDTYDTIDWLLQNTENNGRVGIYGISYPGFYASASLPDAHPAIKAVSPQAPVTDEFVGDDCNHNGAFFLLDNFDFYNYFDGKRSADSQDYQPVFTSTYADAYQFFLKLGSLHNANTAAYFHDPSMVWRQAVDHDTYDSFWQARNIRPHLKNIKPAVLVVGGWYDAEDLFGALRTYEAIETQTPGNNNRLVMGPWTHGAWAKKSWTDFGGYDFGSNVNQYYKDSIETRFFNYYLKDKGSFNRPEVTVFETGSNQWKTYNSWPAANAVTTTFYFQTGKKLSTQKPGAATSFDSYTSDPANPVPYTDSVHEERNNAYMIEDQRFAARRPDVLLFESDTLTNDITVTGRLKANLYVSTTGTDADFIVKLIDEYPNGVQRMVRAEVFRGKFRHSYEKPEAFVPGKIEHIAFDLNEIAHCFKKGHRITVQVQSSWFPLVDRNPQKFMKIPDAQESDFQKAGIRVYHDAKNCSNIVLPILQ